MLLIVGGLWSLELMGFDTISLLHVLAHLSSLRSIYELDRISTVLYYTQPRHFSRLWIYPHVLQAASLQWCREIQKLFFLDCIVYVPVSEYVGDTRSPRWEVISFLKPADMYHTDIALTYITIYNIIEDLAKKATYIHTSKTIHRT